MEQGLEIAILGTGQLRLLTLLRLRSFITAPSCRATRPQSSPFAEPLWADPDLKSGISEEEEAEK